MKKTIAARIDEEQRLNRVMDELSKRLTDATRSEEE